MQANIRTWYTTLMLSKYIEQPSLKKTKGFTIIELLVVIVIIGILAAITIVAYNGISGRAKVVAMSADLKTASSKLETDKAATGTYPASAAEADGGAGLKTSPGNSFTYYADYRGQPSSYCITGTIAGNSQAYTASSAHGTKEGQCEIVTVTKGSARAGCSSNCNFVAFNTSNITAGTYSVTCVIDGSEGIPSFQTLSGNAYVQLSCWTNLTGRQVYVKLANWGQSLPITW